MAESTSGDNALREGLLAGKVEMMMPLSEMKGEKKPCSRQQLVRKLGEIVIVCLVLGWLSVLTVSQFGNNGSHPSDGNIGTFHDNHPRSEERNRRHLGELEFHWVCLTF